MKKMFSIVLFVVCFYVLSRLWLLKYYFMWLYKTYFIHLIFDMLIALLTCILYFFFSFFFLPEKYLLNSLEAAMSSAGALMLTIQCKPLSALLLWLSVSLSSLYMLFYRFKTHLKFHGLRLGRAGTSARWEPSRVEPGSRALGAWKLSSRSLSPSQIAATNKLEMKPFSKQCNPLLRWLCLVSYPVQERERESWCQKLE